MFNDTDKKRKATECTVYMISLQTAAASKDDTGLPGGVHFGDTPEQVLEALGRPSRVIDNSDDDYIEGVVQFEYYAPDGEQSHSMYFMFYESELMTVYSCIEP